MRELCCESCRGAWLLVVEDVGDVEAKCCGEDGDSGQRQFQGMTACIGNGSKDPSLKMGSRKCSVSSSLQKR